MVDDVEVSNVAFTVSERIEFFENRMGCWPSSKDIWVNSELSLGDVGRGKMELIAEGLVDEVFVATSRDQDQRYRSLRVVEMREQSD